MVFRQLAITERSTSFVRHLPMNSPPPLGQGPPPTLSPNEGMNSFSRRSRSTDWAPVRELTAGMVSPTEFLRASNRRRRASSCCLMNLEYLRAFNLINPRVTSGFIICFVRYNFMVYCNLLSLANNIDNPSSRAHLPKILAEGDFARSPLKIGPNFPGQLYASRAERHVVVARGLDWGRRARPLDQPIRPSVP